jgi:hypothetical protein
VTRIGDELAWDLASGVYSILSGGVDDGYDDPATVVQRLCDIPGESFSDSRLPRLAEAVMWLQPSPNECWKRQQQTALSGWLVHRCGALSATYTRSGGQAQIGPVDRLAASRVAWMESLLASGPD